MKHYNSGQREMIESFGNSKNRRWRSAEFTTLRHVSKSVIVGAADGELRWHSRQSAQGCAEQFPLQHHLALLLLCYRQTDRRTQWNILPNLLGTLQDSSTRLTLFNMHVATRFCQCNLAVVNWSWRLCEENQTRLESVCFPCCHPIHII